jgi:hypothetical protein
MARRLEPYIGYRMSRAALSKAERSVYGGPIRRFDADEILSLARIFNKQVGDFFYPPEPHFRGKRVMVNGKPGDPKARVTSNPMSRDQIIGLAVRVVTEPRTEAERLSLEAGSNAIIARLFELLEKAAERIGRSYLESHPEAVPKFFAGDPGVMNQIKEAVVTARLGIDTAAQEKKLADEIVHPSNEASASARRTRPRKNR